MAAVWGQKLLKDVKARTEQFANDQQALVEEICVWAQERTETTTSQLMSNQRKRIARRAAQMQDVGKEAVTDLRKVVKQTLSDAIERPIRTACDKFVKDGNDSGPGVKSRILILFQELSRRSTKAAQEPATRILHENFSAVRNEVRSAFENWGDPLQETADLIVRRHSNKMTRDDAEKRGEMLREIESVLGSEPRVELSAAS
jgi:gas vesicle protein